MAACRTCIVWRDVFADKSCGLRLIASDARAIKRLLRRATTRCKCSSNYVKPRIYLYFMFFNLVYVQPVGWSQYSSGIYSRRNTRVRM